MQEEPLTLLPDAVRYCLLIPMPRCLRELESLEHGQKEAVAASSRAREVRGQSGTPLGDPAIKIDSPFPGIQMAGLHEDITLKAAKPSSLDTLQELKEESETTRRNSLRKGEKSKEACVKKSKKEFQEKGVACRANCHKVPKWGATWLAGWGESGVSPEPLESLRPAHVLIREETLFHFLKKMAPSNKPPLLRYGLLL